MTAQILSLIKELNADQLFTLTFVSNVVEWEGQESLATSSSLTQAIRIIRFNSTVTETSSFISIDN